MMDSLVFIQLRWLDVLDIFLVAILLYQLYRLAKGTVAVRIFIGILFLLIIWKLMEALQMKLVSNILGQFIGIGAIAVIIIFQPELRNFLIQIGSKGFFGDAGIMARFRNQGKAGTDSGLFELQKAVDRLSLSKTGALFVLGSSDDFTELMESGERIDARLSANLIEVIFQKESLLHDGAALIIGERIVSAGCVLPLTHQTNLPRKYGLRHRAALGISEVNNSISVLVSEETGKVSIAHNGRLETLKESSRMKDRVQEISNNES